MKSLIFSASMVRALLDGRKTRTSRIIKPQPKWVCLRPEDKPEMIWQDGIYGAIWYVPIPGGEDGSDVEWTGEFVPAPLAVGDIVFIIMAPPTLNRQSPESRFWDRVIKTDTCWEWMGCAHGHAKHGLIRVGKTSIPVHRYSWMLHRGDPGNARVLHTCDVGWCVNPDHLYLGTDSDNRRDQTERGRIRILCGDESRSSKISDSQVEAIRESWRRGVKQQSLADQYGINQSQVSRIIHGLRRNQKTVPPLPLLGSRWIEITAVKACRIQSMNFHEWVADFCPSKIEQEKALATFTGAQYQQDHAKALWDSLHGAGAWERNDYVWAYDFRRVVNHGGDEGGRK